MANYITTRGDNIALTSNFCINSIMRGGSGREGGKNLQLTWLLFFPYLRINFFFGSYNYHMYSKYLNFLV